MAGQLQQRGLSHRLHSTALRYDYYSTPCSRQRVCTAAALSPLRGSSTLGRGVSAGLGALPDSSSGRPHKEVLCVQRRAPAAARASTGATPLPTRTAGPASPSPSLPWGSGLERQRQMRRLIMRLQLDGVKVAVGSAAASDFPDSPGDGWATALAYRQHVERVVARLREDPDAQVQVAAVGAYGRRLRAWAPGDESVRPKVLAAIRAALARTLGRRKVHTDLPAGSGLDRKAGGGIYMHKSVNARTVNVGSVAGGDFPDSPGDGWATALAYRQHMKRVVARLREDPDAEVQVAEVDDRGWRLHAWAPGDESLRPSVLAAIRGALARTRSRRKVGTDLPAESGLARTAGQGLYMHKFIAVRSVHLGSAACGDFPNTPGDGWATALAYRRHVERVVARLREDPDAQVQVAEVDDRGRRLRAWAPGDDSVRPSVLAAIRRALGLEPQGTQGRRRKYPDFPEGTGLSRDARGPMLNRSVQGRMTHLGSAAGGDFPDSPGDGWAMALAYRQHMERVVARLREDPGAEVQVAEVGKYGRRLRAWAPGDESVRPKVLAAIRRALT